MKSNLLILFLAVSVPVADLCGESAESLPPAQMILTAARNQLPPKPVRMTGALRERAPNGFVKKSLSIEMELMWGEQPARAVYRIRDEKKGTIQTLEIVWKAAGAEYSYAKDGKPVDGFNPHTVIEGFGVTWADLSFSFLWSPDAQTEGSAKKLGKKCFTVSIPRPDNRTLLLWIEKTTGRMLGAKEKTAEGKTDKIIKVVSVKEFDGLWMVKDLDIIRPSHSGKTSLRIDTVERF